MTIHPFLIGSGRSGDAIAKSLALISLQHPEITLSKPVRVQRNQPLEGLAAGLELPLLCIANPHGLHAATLKEAARAGFRHIICEKPICVTLNEVHELRALKAQVAVLHGYRVMWGPQTIKQWITSGEFGEVFAVEGRYWQSSTAQKAMESKSGKSTGWKNDISLSGPHDALLDLGTHWMDMAIFFMGELPTRGDGWLSHANSEAPHRDSHVHLSMEFPKGKRALGSISKTVHGATNHFEIHVLGTKKSASWSFLSPDEIRVGTGAEISTHVRKSDATASGQPPFHALGWLEGYLGVIKNFLLSISSGIPTGYPTLEESLNVVEKTLSVKFSKD